MWHPNVYEDGGVCISILHAPGTDEWGYEDAGERWLPVHTIESIVSVDFFVVSQIIYTEFPNYPTAAFRYQPSLIGHPKP